MIEFRTTINTEAQTVTLSLTEGEPDEERHGRMCHRVNQTILDPHNRSLLAALGYEPVCIETVGFFDVYEFWSRIGQS